MKRFDILKTLQLVLLIILTITALVTIMRDPVLYGMIASDSHVRLLCIILWLVLGVSFAFLLYDFNAYTGLKRENTELDNAMYSDPLTGVANRYSVDAYIGRYLNRPLPEDCGCVTVDLANLSEINRKLGHSGGDAAIQEFALILQNAAGNGCFVGRNGGNKFVTIMQECTQKRIDAFLENVKDQVTRRNENAPDAEIRYTVGAAFAGTDTAGSLPELIALSDRRAVQE